MAAWAALKKRFLVIGGPRVTPSPAHLREYERSYGAAAPRDYQDLMHHFGPGTFNDFAHVAPPHHLQTYGERMHGPPDAHLVFASTDNGDDFAWSLAPRAKGVLVRRGRGDTFDRFGSDMGDFVARAADRNLLFDDAPLQPFFVPMHRRRALSFRFASSPATSLRTTERILAQAKHRKEGWCSWTLHLADADGIAHIQAVGGEKTWWSVRVVCPLAAKMKPVAATLATMTPGWKPADFDAALAKAKATELGLDV